GFKNGFQAPWPPRRAGRADSTRRLWPGAATCILVKRNPARRSPRRGRTSAADSIQPEVIPAPAGAVQPSMSSAMALSFAPFDGSIRGTAGFASLRTAPPVLRAGAGALLGAFPNGKAHAHRRG